MITLGVILGYACWPLAWLLGIPAAECMEAGRLIGLKTVANEFIAYDQLGKATIGEGGLEPADRRCPDLRAGRL